LKRKEIIEQIKQIADEGFLRKLNKWEKWKTSDLKETLNYLKMVKDNEKQIN